MLQGKTKSGFEFTLDEERLDNYELLEALGELEENVYLLPKVIKLLLGKEQEKALKEHLKTEKGIVPSKIMEAELKEIFESVPTLNLKNS